MLPKTLLNPTPPPFFVAPFPFPFPLPVSSSDPTVATTPIPRQYSLLFGWRNNTNTTSTSTFTSTTLSNTMTLTPCFHTFLILILFSLLPCYLAAAAVQSIMTTNPSSQSQGTIPAFPEQADVARCPLSLSDEHLNGIKTACGGPNKDGADKELHRSRCCPVLAAWLYSAYSATALGTGTRHGHTTSYDMPLLPDDSETCESDLGKALKIRGIELVQPNETCDVVYCYCGIRLHPLSCPESFSLTPGGNLVGDESVKKLERNCLSSSTDVNGFPGLGGCNQCLHSLFLHVLAGLGKDVFTLQAMTVKLGALLQQKNLSLSLVFVFIMSLNMSLFYKHMILYSFIFMFWYSFICMVEHFFLHSTIFFKLQTQLQIIWACFELHNFLRRMDSGDLDILESLEKIGGLQDNEQNFNDGDDNGVPNNDEWRGPTQADVRYIEEIRNTIRDQLPRRGQQRH